MKSMSCLRGWSLGTIRYWMFGRSKLDTKCRARPIRSRSVSSSWVARVAVAVSAILGICGNSSARRDSPR